MARYYALVLALALAFSTVASDATKFDLQPGKLLDMTTDGGTSIAFSHYENGKTKPPLALVKLLRVLDRHSDLLEEIKVA